MSLGYNDIVQWLSGVQNAQCPISPPGPIDQAKACHGELYSQTISDSSEALTPSSSTLNSVHRSTLELLKGLPAPIDMYMTLPTLPTQHATLPELLATLPDAVSKPLVSVIYWLLFHSELTF